MRGWKILGVGVVLMILSPLMVVAASAENCPTSGTTPKVAVTYSFSEKGISFEVSPWVVDVCKNEEVEWEFDGVLGGEFEVVIPEEKEHKGPNAVGAWKKNGKGKKKVKLGEFKHKGSENDDEEEIVEAGAYEIILTIQGVGKITIDPGYRVWP